MSEWQVIISDLLQQIIIMFSPKTLKQNNKKDKRKSYEKKKVLLKHGQKLLLNQKVSLNVSEKLP